MMVLLIYYSFSKSFVIVWCCIYLHIIRVSTSGAMACLNADKTKYMVMSRDKVAGQSISIKTDNSSCKW